MYYLRNLKTNQVTLHSDIGQFQGGSEKEVDLQWHRYMMALDETYNDQYNWEINTPLNIRSIKATLNTSDLNKPVFSPGTQSLVGVSKDTSYPIGWGNYWSAVIEPKSRSFEDLAASSYPVVNMWIENYKKIVNQLNLKEIHCTIVNGLCFITDPHIPMDWMFNEPFLTYNTHRYVSTGERYKINNWYRRARLNFAQLPFIVYN